ncbi:hypothetical protein HL653_15865 [Sphingomonas sp. AP4-R1]|uniref:autotransporter outer membrane beta-barrel domain-containing protein n=1 Tax=Sphingomonas sp. AP4-R1 TaxID=2735134 RepID=UPI00149391A5|nr:autotransporter outer membrane beta-barrel domain-containing protein [Sphingomonas sp. AP4-R1]QJU59041.1 hypothetical protein HL653_15865 [Sphingomonas sp. AP4-R1]
MTKTALLRALFLSGTACVGAVALPPVAAAQATAALPSYTLDSSNATVGTWSLSAGSLGSGVLSNPSTLTTGSNVFNYVAVYFSPTLTATYTFDQTFAPVDTVMILYSGIFDPLNPGLNAIIGNDDTPAASHQTAGMGIGTNCGTANFCPQVSAALTAGTPITLVISTFRAGAALGLPQTFYASGPGDFTADQTTLPTPPVQTPAVTTPTPGSALPTGAYLDGGTVQLDGDVTSDLPVSTNGGTIDTAQGSHTLSGNLSNYLGAATAGDVTVSGGNTLTLTGANNGYTGTMIVTGNSTLSVAGTNSLGGGGLTLDNGTLATTAALNAATAVTLAGTSNVIDTGNNLVTLAGGLSGTGGVTVTGGNVVAITGANTATGGLTVTGGTTLSVAGTNSLGAGGLTLNNGTLTTTAALNAATAVALAGTSNVIDTANNEVTLAGGLTGTGGVTVTGGNVVAITGANTATGGLTVTGGTTLSVAGTNSLGAGGLTLNSGTLTTTAALNAATAVALAGTSNVIDTANNEVTLAGGLTGTGGVTVTGGNVVAITGANSATGGLTITGGTTLSVAGTNSLGTGGLTLNSGTLSTTAALNAAAPVTVAGTSNVINTGNNLVTLAGGLSGNGGLTLTGGNVVAITGANSATGGFTVTGGTTLSVAGTNSLGTGSLTLTNGTLSTTAALNAAAPVTIAGTSNVINTGNNLVMLAGGLAGTGGVTVTGGNVVAITGANSATGGLTVTGGTTLSVAGTNSLGTGGLALNSGTLTTTAALNAAAPVTVAGTGNVINTGNNAVTLAGGLTGTGALTLTGGNTIAMGGTSTLNGAISLQGGTKLIVGSPSMAGSLSACGGILVGANSTIGGNGTICSTTVASAGIMSPGNSPGTLTVAGNVTLNTGSVLLLDVDGRTYSALGGAGSYDRVNVTGAFVSHGTITPNLRGITGSANNTFTPVLGDVFTVVTAGSVSGNFQTIVQPTVGMAANTRFDVRYNAMSVQLIVTPASFATLANTNGWVSNARNTAAALDTVRPDAANLTGPLAPVFAGLYGLDANGLRVGVQQLSGEIHAQALQAVTAASMAGLQVVRDAAGDGFGGFGAAAPRRGGIWGQYLRYTTSPSGDSHASGYRSTNDGFVMGASIASGEKTMIGVAGSYLRNTVTTDLAARSQATIGAGYLYGVFRPSEAMQITGVVGGSLADLYTRRAIATTGAAVTATSDKQVLAVMASLDGRYRVVASGGLSLWGTAGVSVNESSIGTIAERATSSAYALSLEADSRASTQSRIGAQAQYAVGPATLSVTGNWLHQMGDLPDGRRTVRLGDANWQIQSVRLNRNGFSYGGSLRTRLGQRMMAQVSYERSDLGDHANGNRLAVGLQLLF